jgi:hypothetical protein
MRGGTVRKAVLIATARALWVLAKRLERAGTKLFVRAHRVRGP